MQRESPLHRGERFAIEAQLHAQWLDAVSYDVATFAMYLLDDDEGGESPCFVHAWSFDATSRISDGFSDGPSSKRRGLSRIPGFLTSVTSPKPTCKVASPPLAAMSRPRRSKNPAIPPVGRMAARVVCNGITACVGRRARFRVSAAMPSATGFNPVMTEPVRDPTSVEPEKSDLHVFARQGCPWGRDR
jgi:hypothetical protein